MNLCSKCGINERYKHSSWCPPCIRLYANQRNKDRPELMRRYKANWDPLRAYFYKKAMRLRKVNRSLGLPDDIRIDHLLSIHHKQQGLCALTGRTLVMSSLATEPDALSIDRVNTEPGYRVENLRFITNQANAARGVGSDDALFEFCKDVLKEKQ